MPIFFWILYSMATYVFMFVSDIYFAIIIQ